MAKTLTISELTQLARESPTALTVEQLSQIKRLQKLSPERTESTADICEAFGIHVSTLKRWIKLGLPRGKRGNQDALASGEVALWLKEHPQLGGTPGRPKSEHSAARQSAELRKIEAMALLYEINVAKTMNEIITIEDANAVFVEVLTNAKNRLLQLPSAICGQLEGLPAATIQEILESRILEILDSASRAGNLARQRLPVAPSTEATQAE